MKFLKNKYTKLIWFLFLGLFLYGLWYIISGQSSIPPHYHANFAVFIEWKKFDFSADKYMEDVAACKAWAEIFPRDRVHLHENNGDTIHIHHWGVTWGHFFANNGITFSSSHISFEDWEKVLYNNETNVMKFVLNGKEVENPFNRYMLSWDKLLVSYWEEDINSAIKILYPQIVSNAADYNEKYDPWSCWWTNENSTLYLLKNLLHLWHH